MEDRVLWDTFAEATVGYCKSSSIDDVQRETFDGILVQSRHISSQYHWPMAGNVIQLRKESGHFAKDCS